MWPPNIRLQSGHDSFPFCGCVALARRQTDKCVLDFPANGKGEHCHGKHDPPQGEERQEEWKEARAGLEHPGSNPKGGVGKKIVQIDETNFWHTKNNVVADATAFIGLMHTDNWLVVLFLAAALECCGGRIFLLAMVDIVCRPAAKTGGHHDATVTTR